MQILKCLCPALALPSRSIQRRYSWHSWRYFSTKRAGTICQKEGLDQDGNLDIECAMDPIRAMRRLMNLSYLKTFDTSAKSIIHRHVVALYRSLDVTHCERLTAIDRNMLFRAIMDVPPSNLGNSKEVNHYNLLVSIANQMVSNMTEDKRKKGAERLPLWIRQALLRAAILNWRRCPIPEKMRYKVAFERLKVHMLLLRAGVGDGILRSDWPRHTTTRRKWWDRYAILLEKSQESENVLFALAGSRLVHDSMAATPWMQRVLHRAFNSHHWEANLYIAGLLHESILNAHQGRIIAENVCLEDVLADISLMRHLREAHSSFTDSMVPNVSPGNLDSTSVKFYRLILSQLARAATSPGLQNGDRRWAARAAEQVYHELNSRGLYTTTLPPCIEHLRRSSIVNSGSQQYDKASAKRNVYSVVYHDLKNRALNRQDVNEPFPELSGISPDRILLTSILSALNLVRATSPIIQNAGHEVINTWDSLLTSSVHFHRVKPDTASFLEQLRFKLRELRPGETRKIIESIRSALDAMKRSNVEFDARFMSMLLTELQRLQCRSSLNGIVDCVAGILVKLDTDGDQSLPPMWMDSQLLEKMVRIAVQTGNSSAATALAGVSKKINRINGIKAYI